MSEGRALGAPLPPLPYDDWLPTRQTLQAVMQMIGKLRLSLMPPRNHWWNVPMYVNARGLTTRLIPHQNGAIEITLDVFDSRIHVDATDGTRESIGLPGLDVASVHDELTQIMRAHGYADAIPNPVPYELTWSTPFPDDHQHRAWDAAAVRDWWQSAVWCHGILTEFAGRFVGKSSPVHYFWHSFDLALTRFSGREAPPMDGAGRVAREAYSHEVISFGWWPGDDLFREAAWYAYAAPEPDALRETSIGPQGAEWIVRNNGSLAVYRWKDCIAASDPRAATLEFLESAYTAAARLAKWETDALRKKQP